MVFTDYGKRGHLDILRPDIDDLAGAPVLLQVHGGAWTVGRKDQQGQPLMYRMARKGSICVAINYRLAPRDYFPAQILDVKAALAWIKEHIADYGGDPSYVAITGGSAGGHLAALAALTPNAPEWQPGFEDVDTSVQAAVPFYGVYDFAGSTGLRSAELMRDGFLAPRVLKRKFADDPAAFEAASPDPADHRPGAGLLRAARRRRHPGQRRSGPAVRGSIAPGVTQQGGVRRVPRRPARLRHLPLDPRRPLHPRGGQVPDLVVEHPPIRRPGTSARVNPAQRAQVHA